MNLVDDRFILQIIHIDYNICFEKGRKLRVPEKVPYRLTQNLQNALGTGGLDGVFSLSSENVLKILRSGKEILLNLLESFIYDPLIDWTGHDTGVLAAFYGGENNFYNQIMKKKRQVEKESLLRMFQLRIVEIRSTWLQLRHDDRNYFLDSINVRFLLKFFSDTFGRVMTKLIQRVQESSDIDQNIQENERKTKIFEKSLEYFRNSTNSLSSLIER